MFLILQATKLPMGQNDKQQPAGTTLLRVSVWLNSQIEHGQLYHGTLALYLLQAEAAGATMTRAPGKALLARRKPTGDCHLLKAQH